MKQEHSSAQSSTSNSSVIFSLLNFEEGREFIGTLISSDIADHIFENTSMRMEDYMEFDLLCIPLFNSFENLKNSTPLYIFVQKNNISLISTNPDHLSSLFEKLKKEKGQILTSGAFICSFLEHLLRNDLEMLDHIETRISDLEDRVLTDKQENFTREIIQERKLLMSIMHYYEELLNIIESIDMNEKQIFNSRSIHYLNIINGKAQRLYSKAKTIREYISEIREAYQAEVDIRTNTIMKVLTVVTMIFMPLTLIVGWYGMNLNMPEYGFEAAYPIVIIASILVAVICIFYFKKHKWF